MNRDELRERIDLMERLHDVMGAMDEMAGAELKPGETVDLRLSERDHDKTPITTLHGFPPVLVMVGLQAMQRALEAKLAATEGVAA